MTKTCSKCKEQKSLSEFTKNPVYKDGLSCQCKMCQKVYNRAYYVAHRGHLQAAGRDQRLKRKYGLSQKDYVRMYAFQLGRCAICHEAGDLGELFVDHDHATGRIRGLLCDACNNMLGRARDNQATLVAAIAYLKSFE